MECGTPRLLAALGAFCPRRYGPGDERLGASHRPQPPTGYACSPVVVVELPSGASFGMNSRYWRRRTASGT